MIITSTRFENRNNEKNKKQPIETLGGSLQTINHNTETVATSQPETRIQILNTGSDWI